MTRSTLNPLLAAKYGPSDTVSTLATKYYANLALSGRIPYSDTSLASWVSRLTLNGLLSGKQASGTYLVPSDSTNQRTYSTSLYQPKGTYGDTTNMATRLYVQQIGTLDTTGIAAKINAKADSTDRATRTYTRQIGTLDTTGMAYAANVTTLLAGKLANADSTDKATRTYVRAIATLDTTGMAYASNVTTLLAGKLANADSTDKATRTYVRAIGTLDTTGMAYAANVTTLLAGKATQGDTAGMTTVSAVNTLRNADTTRALVRERSAGNGTAYYGAGTWGTNAENQTASTTQLNVSGHMRAFPFFIGKTMTIDSVNYIVSTAAAGACTIAIYTDSAVAGVGPSYPLTRIVLGARDTTSATLKAISLRSVPVQMTAGLYWLVVSSNGTATLRSHPMSAVPNVMGYNPAVTVTQEYSCYDVTRSYDQFLPSPFTTGGTATVAITPPLIVFRIKSVP